MGEYKRVLLLILTLSVVVAAATGIAIGVLYDTAYERQRVQLTDSAHSMARLIEAMAAFDLRYRHAYPGTPEEATLEQIRDAFESEHTMRATTELTLARQLGNEIVFLMRHRHAAGGPPAPVAWNSDLAEPMRRALQGEAGSVAGLDYHGEPVLAAFEPVRALDLGVVAKIDLAEIRAPFVRAGLIVTAVSLALILIGTALFRRLTDPMLRTIRRRGEQLDLILASTGEGIFGMDRQGHCTFANRAALQMLGYRHQDDLLGQNIHELIHHTHPDGSPHPRDECPTSRAIARGETLVVESEMLWRADGSGFPAEYRTRPMHRGGEIVGAVVSFVDITERRRQELTLQHAQRMEILGRLTGGIAHDFNNLLTIILGNLRLLGRRFTAEADADPERRELVEDALSAAEDGVGLTQRLLAFSRKQQLSPESVDLGAFLRDNRRFLSRIAGETVEFTLETTAASMPTRIDKQQLQTALLNLTINACDAMPDGGSLRIAADTVRIDPTDNSETEPGDYVRITVTDTGCGMSRETITRAVEPFFTTKPATKGSGLGLSMVYGFVTQSGGDLSISSEPGRGTSVSLLFPKQPVTTARENEKPQPENPLGVAGNRQVVLVVEDEERLRRFAARTLSALGYEVMEAADARQACELLSTHPRVAVLFSDVVMPGGMDGHALAAWASLHLPDIRVLLTTGYSEQTAGIADHRFPVLAKPYGETDLRQAIERVLIVQDSGTRAG